MLQNYWKSATSAIATINENISTALEGLDKDMDTAATNTPDALSTNGYDNSPNNEDNNDITHELELYKKLLEDAQMQQVQLSKQLGSIIAGKDVEIAVLKANQSGSTPTASDSDDNAGIESNLRFIQMQQEKTALEKAMEDYDIRYQEALRAANEGKVLQGKYESLSKKYASLDYVYNDLKQNSEDTIKQKTEEIENLVLEYSKLAADCELRHDSDVKKLQEIYNENETLTTKIAALEHSIEEFADRAAANSFHGKVSSDGGSPISSHSQGNAEIKELRAKLINVQFDLKEREDTISSLRAQIQELISMPQIPVAEAAAVVSPEAVTSLEKQIDELQAQKKHMTGDLERLIVEKKEAEEAGKKFFDENRTFKREIEPLRSQVQSLTQEITQLKQQLIDQQTLHETNAHQFRQMNESADSEASSIINSLEQQVAALNKALEEVKLSDASKSKEYEDNLKKLTMTLAEKESQLNAVTVEIEQLHQVISSKEKSSNDSHSTLQDDVNRLQEQLNHAQRNSEALEQKLQTLQSQLDETVAIKQKLEADALALRQLDAASKSESALIVQQLEESHKTMMETFKNDAVMKLENLKADYEKRIQSLHDTNDESLRESIEREQETSRLAIEQLKTLHTDVIEEWSKQCDSLRNTVKELQEKLQQNQENHEEEARKLNEVIKNANDDAMMTKKLMTETLKTKEQEYHSAMERKEMELESKYHQAIDALSTAHANEKLEAIRSTEIKAQQTLQEELVKRDEYHQDILAQQLEILKALKQRELDVALSDAKIVADKCLNDSLQAAKRDAESILEALRMDLEGKIEDLKVTTQKAKDDLANVEKRYEVKMVEALAALDAKKEGEKAAALNALRNSMQKVVDDALAEKEEYLALYSKENKLRKAIHNKLLEIQGNIRVICRVRPILEVERRSGEDIDVTGFPSPEDLTIQRDPNTKTRFEYDRVFAPSSSQQEVFDAIQPLVVSVLDGYNICIFAYGQTGSGKTFTMEGYGSDIGVSPRAISELFRLVHEMEDNWTFTLTFSMLEIYNETILDLLDSNPNKDKLDIRQTPDGNTVSGLTEILIYSPEQVGTLMVQGQKNRAVGAHDMNERSSRSHSILTVVCRGKNKVDGTSTFGKLNLIDLAGSERVSKTDATGDRLKEAQNINKSLFALGDVINALGNKKSTHVPYRNSKLTFLLQDSLGGNSKVLMVVNISPAIYNLGETLCSLAFASKCRNTELGQASKKVTNDDSSTGTTSSGTSTSSSASSKLSSPATVKRSESSSSMSSASASSSRRLSALPPSSAMKK